MRLGPFWPLLILAASGQMSDSFVPCRLDMNRDKAADLPGVQKYKEKV